MAVRFDNTSGKHLQRTSDLLDYNSPYTLMGWLYPISGTGSWSSFFTMSHITDGEIDVLQMNNNSPDTWEVYCQTVAGGEFGSDTGSDIVYNQWVHLAMVRTSQTNLYVYLNGVLDMTNTTDMTSRAAIGLNGLGATFYTGEWTEEVDGRMAAVKAWTAALSVAEVRAEMYKVVPVRFSNLYGFWPIIAGSSERIRDYSGNGRNWTAGGTLTDEAGPPVPFGLYSPRMAIIISGGTTETVTVTGSSSPSGVLIRQPKIFYLGSITPSSDVTKDVDNIVSGEIAPTGNLLKKISTFMSGAITLAGNATAALVQALQDYFLWVRR